MKGRKLAIAVSLLIMLPALLFLPVAPGKADEPYRGAGLGYGPARAWGNNYYGQLGNGSNADSNTPVQVFGLFGATAVAAGGYHSLAIPVHTWYLAEGSTYGGMESWVCVQNPNPGEVRVNVSFMTETGAITGPQNFPIAGNSRYSFRLNSLVPNKKSVSTRVTSAGGGVICERPVYGPGKAWAHDSIGRPE